MNKRYIYHVWTKIRLVKTRYVLAAVLLSLLFSVFALRANNEHMVKLRNQVYAADKSGANVQAALQNLQAYVTTNMNTNLSSGANAVYPPIQLEYTYERLAQSQASQASSSNSELYTEAQSYCEQQDPVDFSGHNRVPCIEQYVESHGASSTTQIPTSLYEFAFVSPVWSPDLAGWSLVVTAIIGILFLTSLATELWMKHQVR
jgi:hypothetical protein